MSEQDSEDSMGSLPASDPRDRGGRFDRLERLIGAGSLSRIEGAHVVVIGLGGVGSFAVEGLARSGVGRLTLVDGDRVCESNINRQLQALESTTGRHKAELLAARVREINPRCDVRPVVAFYGAANAESLLPLSDPPDWVVDAIDSVPDKLHLMDRCRRHGFSLISSMGAVGKLDATAVRVADLYDTHSDSLARIVRKRLRREYGWPRPEAGVHATSGVLTVFSVEPRQKLSSLSPEAAQERARRGGIEGSAVFVTASFGLAASGVVIRALAK